MFVLSRRLVRAIPALAMLCLTLFPAGEARAAAPPDLPLPPCTLVDGVQQGACPRESPDLTVAAIGRFGAGSTVNVMTIPMHPVCDHHTGYPPYPWSPSPCYSAVMAPNIQGCAVIDLRDGQQRYREMPCSQALYKSAQDLPTPLVTTMGPHGDSRCSASGDYQTYIWGGPANVPGERWAERGPPFLECFMRFNGPRPDGLYGPTWMILNVGIDLAQNGDERRGQGRRAQVFVPVDGDLRLEGVDVSVSGTVTLDEADWDAGRLIATYTATVRNIGNERARNLELTARLSTVMAVTDVSEPECLQPPPPGGDAPPQFGTPLVPGRGLTCRWSALEVNETRTVRVQVRILNATDLHAIQSGIKLQNFPNQSEGLRFLVRADDDRVSSNDIALVKLDIPFRSGSYEQTRAAMEVLAPYFDYQTERFGFEQCNVYKMDILDRLGQIRVAHPEAFANLSYGGITSGDYLIAGIDSHVTRAGHVGVVVYTRGTDYRQTGIIINGTPSPSPLTLVSEIGAHDPGGGFGVGGWTGLNGQYLRTAANRFPGTPQAEGNNYNGFEGLYPDNAAEFIYGGGGGSAPPGTNPMDAATCPAPPDAVQVTTHSPVDILLTNPRGQRVRTRGGLLELQELESSIHSIAMPHEDGTHGWTLLLPKDDYDIALTGTGEGPYRITLTTFDANGQPIDFVTEGTTAPGQVHTYVLDGGGTGSGPGINPGPGPGPDPGAGSGGGGGTLGWPAAVGLLLLGLARRRAQPRR